VPKPSTGTSTPVLPNGRVGTLTVSSEASADKFLSGKADAAPAAQATFRKVLRSNWVSFFHHKHFVLYN
jgi:hypothetical protein